MKCIYCDTMLPERAVFCPKCGSPAVGEEPLTCADRASIARHHRHCRKAATAVAASVGISAAVGAAVALIVINRRAISQTAGRGLMKMRGRLSRFSALEVSPCCVRRHSPRV
jgi:hypothetical protein